MYTDMREFDVNHSFIYVLAVIVIAFVFAQSLFFLIMAWRNAVKLGVDKAVLRRVASSSAIFTIAPAIAILLGVIALSHSLGLPLPWLRMNVLGAITFELPAAEMAASAAGSSLITTITDARVFSTIAWVMTLGMMAPMVIAPIFLKKIQSGLVKVGAKDKKWGEIFMSALLLGMVSAFLGMILDEVGTGLSGWIPFFVLLLSAAIMAVLGMIFKKRNMIWLENYAMPLSMLGAMAFSIPLTGWLV